MWHEALCMVMVESTVLVSHEALCMVMVDSTVLVWHKASYMEYLCGMKPCSCTWSWLILHGMKHCTWSTGVA